MNFIEIVLPVVVVRECDWNVLATGTSERERKRDRKRMSERDRETMRERARKISFP